MYEFHISRFARDRYEFDRAIYQLSGNVILADFSAARTFSDRMNTRRDLVRFPETAVSPGEIHAMGLIDEILHVLVADFRNRIEPGLMTAAADALREELGVKRFEQVLAAFTGLFPPVAVYRGEQTAEEYLAGENGGIPNFEIALEELLMLRLSNDNPAFARHAELFDDRTLEKQTAYRRMAAGLERFFEDRPGPNGGKETLLDLLRAPARKHPESLTAQLEYLLRTFPTLLEKYQVRILRSLDLMREESRPAFVGPGPVRVMDFARLGPSLEIENFSPDRDWMPRLILIAKNAHVWLDQLSKAHGREIRRLDQVPQEELDEIARRGFTGLWLIGLWERSPASKTIKHLTGNPDAVSSAYSLYDYTIAADLGGDAAYETLRDRAADAGIRLAADMVPNHTGIYSKWILERPDWFVSVDHPPYPAYSFDGPDLSSHPDVGIYLEDHYYSRTDAAVVFKRLDRRSGRTLYIYHGNDGTSMPWNDTAQLDYTNSEVRETVIGTILGVARKFSVIRFDAAMTLAKKHIQRLWFPEPGQGGAIPSRAEHGLTAGAFEERIPNEFWREVVDRVAAEVPDTLLLAEAFWLMEGYFVRTLGMHRVYNSAFMHMLRDEKNAEYRRAIKNTLEFDPQILRRYVNFMNNPDEETAVSQFGKGGKYFGVCVLMATLPGLPMFGHGQVEGFHEKYGMEYQRAYYDETPDTHLIERHRREIFPLLHRRAMFAEVDRFRLYDFRTGDGEVDENVFAYSNVGPGGASLVLCHNRWGDTRGRIRRSTAFAEKTDTGAPRLQTGELAAALDLPDDPAAYVIFRESISGMEFIRSCADLHAEGFTAELAAYDYRVFLDFKLVAENEWSHYRLLTDYLDGRGVTDIETVKQEIVLEPVLAPWKRLFAGDLFDSFITASEARISVQGKPDPSGDFLRALREPVESLLEAAAGFLERPGEIEPIAGEILAGFETALAAGSAAEAVQAQRRGDQAILYCWLAAARFGRLVSDRADYPSVVRGWLDDWLLGRAAREFLARHHPEPDVAYPLTALLAGRRPEDWFLPGAPDTARLWLGDAETARFLNVNRYQEIVWFDSDRLELLCTWIETLNALLENENAAELHSAVLARIRTATQIAAHQVEALLAALEEN
ncbi:MAG TPA: alpha-amylase family glycosyl hydrolase [Anaerolineales bacterium]|nr:alpha-amylase family glycosyl hydrolase [Anaerolineales bacterium]